MPLTIVPANEASWDEVRGALGTEARRCYCQRFKLPGREFFYGPVEAREQALREQTRCGNPDATLTTGLIAFLGDEPIGWVAVEPRSGVFQLGQHRVPWTGRTEDRSDESVWAITCFSVRSPHRRLGVMHELAVAARDYAGAHGARIVEGYPMDPEPGKEITWGELHVGTLEAFEAAGFELVTRPTLRRAVVRHRFSGAGPRAR
jgi:GNAT superfamily N-acetyltransferase